MSKYDINKLLIDDLSIHLDINTYDNDKITLEKKFNCYEHKVSRLKSLTRNYSVKFGYYYQSRLKSFAFNHDLVYTELEYEHLKWFNKFNDVYSDHKVLESFNKDIINSIIKVHRAMYKVNNKGKIRKTNKSIYTDFLSGDNILPVRDYNISKYLLELESSNKYLNTKSDALVNSWILHSYLFGIQPFTDANGRLARFFLNKNINIKSDESIFLDHHILKVKDDYYKAVFSYVCDIDKDESISWYINTVNTALEEECQLLDKVILKFYDLLLEYEKMELIISRNAEMLASLFCVDGVYLKNDLVLYFSQDIIDKRTINKLIDKLVEKEILKVENKIYRTRDLKW